MKQKHHKTTEVNEENDIFTCTGAINYEFCILWKKKCTLAYVLIGQNGVWLGGREMDLWKTPYRQAIATVQ